MMRSGGIGGRVRIAGLAAVLALAAAIALASWAALAAPPAAAAAKLPLRRSLLDLRRDQVEIQATDRSCGPAALADLLSHFYGIDAGEADVTKRIWGKGEIPTHGTSLAQLKKAAGDYGLVAQGYRLDLGGLRRYQARAGLPLIAHVHHDTDHFVLVIGFAGEQVVIDDPSWGRKALSSSEFARRWSGYVLVVLPPASALQSARSTVWRTLERAQIRHLRLLGV